MITDYHAKYYVHELTKRCSSGSLEKFAVSLVDAQVDLNPHQVDAALFAFKSPLSRGAILADEVGLGKTIEAGIVLSQKWAERKRRLLIILPSNLRKQWNQELLEKFFLPSCILETGSYKQFLKEGIKNPFLQDEIIICSYHFARNKAEEIKKIKWDLVVIDEAHRLRNVYKTSNKIARAIKDSLFGVPKLLLTATPLQNSLMELYGLVSFVDDYTFGDQKSFKNQFLRLSNQDTFDQLKSRLVNICKRTLRRQVLEYIKYTNRIPITQKFVPTPDEQFLYNEVSEYLRRDNLQALPPSQRSLMTLVMRKLLASSTYAIAGALRSLENKLINRLKKEDERQDIQEVLSEDFETLEEIKEEWEEEDGEERLTPHDMETIKNEISDLHYFNELAESITENAKGKALLLALKTGLKKAEELGANKKAIIFTESRRTQEYLLRILSETEHKDRIVLFNGSNDDPGSKQIYKEWMKKHQGTDKITSSKTADMRSALVDYFKEQAQIMISTEAGAEGVNLQFCSLVVNYDLPWNPQRIEQRIGRCHRYGQKHDVVVVNFLNEKNEADKRVYQLLEEKFALFSGVFGASDEVLGVIESGVDFEKRIMRIYQECRTPEEIQQSFDDLQNEMEEQIDETLKITRNKLLENFDEEVHKKLKVSLKESKEYLNKYENFLWEITRYYLEPYAEFYDEKLSFRLKKNPFKESLSPLGLYKIGQNIEDAYIYRIGHPLAQDIIKYIKNKKLRIDEIIFYYSKHPAKISFIENLPVKSGYLSFDVLSVSALETEDFLIFSGVTEDGRVLEEEQILRFFSLPGKVSNIQIEMKWTDKIKSLIEDRKYNILENITEKNSVFFDEEMDKLDKWADDRRNALKLTLKELDEEIKELKKEARKSANLPEKLAVQKKVKNLEKKRDEAWREYDFSAQKIEDKKDELIDEVEKRLDQKIILQHQFSIKWKIK